jgi:hypothetical protein
MAYSDIALLAVDNDFINRIAACASSEGEKELPPDQWANAHRWELAGTPGFGDKYSSAIAGGIARPGNDPAVISDADILSAVQPLLTPPAA